MLALTAVLLSVGAPSFHHVSHAVDEPARFESDFQRNQIKDAMAELSKDPEIPESYTSCLTEVLLRIHDVGETQSGDMGNRACVSAGRVCGSISEDVEQLRFYMKRALNSDVNHVCETGFFRGESTAVWLCAKETLTVDSFDLEFSGPEYEILQEKFGDRLVSHPGDSSETLPEHFAKEDAACCDLAIADGGHEDDVPALDLTNFADASARSKCAAKPSLMFIDEVFFRMVKPGDLDPYNSFTTTHAVMEVLDSGKAQALQCCGFDRGGWCTMYANHTLAPTTSPFRC